MKSFCCSLIDFLQFLFVCLVRDTIQKVFFMERALVKGEIKSDYLKWIFQVVSKIKLFQTHPKVEYLPKLAKFLNGSKFWERDLEKKLMSLNSVEHEVRVDIWLLAVWVFLCGLACFSSTHRLFEKFCSITFLDSFMFCLFDGSKKSNRILNKISTFVILDSLSFICFQYCDDNAFNKH